MKVKRVFASLNSSLSSASVNGKGYQRAFKYVQYKANQVPVVAEAFWRVFGHDTRQV